MKYCKDKWTNFRNAADYIQFKSLCNWSFVSGVMLRISSMAFSIITPLTLQEVLYRFNENDPDTTKSSFHDYLAAWPTQTLFGLYALTWCAARSLESVASYYVVKGARPSRSNAAFRSLANIYLLPYSQFANMDNEKVRSTTVDVAYTAIGDIVKESVNTFSTVTELLTVSSLIILTFEQKAGVILLSCSVGYSLAVYFVGKSVIGVSETYSNAQAEFRSRLNEMVACLETAQFFDTGGSELAEFREIQLNFEDKYLALERRKEIQIKPLQFAFLGLILFGITYITGTQALDPSSSFNETDFIIINSFLLQIINPLTRLIEYVSKFNEAYGKLVDAIKFCKAAESFLKIKQQRELDYELDEEKEYELKPMMGLNVKFNNFNLAFINKEKRGGEETMSFQTIFNNAYFNINSGEKVVILGATGSGKSTICRVLTRLIEVFNTKASKDFQYIQGSIKINDLDILSFKRRYLRSLIGIVPQKIDIFSGTWRKNLTYGLDIPASDNKIQEALETCLLTDKAPADFDQKINTFQLSGGERQRIGLVRLMLKKPPLIILDEATSALDADTEARFLQRFHLWLERQKAYKPTIIIITHRLSAIHGVDRVLVLDKGNLSENGAPVELMKNSESTFSKLIKMVPCHNPEHQLLPLEQKLSEEEKVTQNLFSIFTKPPALEIPEHQNFEEDESIERTPLPLSESILSMSVQ